MTCFHHRENLRNRYSDTYYLRIVLAIGAFAFISRSVVLVVLLPFVVKLYMYTVDVTILIKFISLPYENGLGKTKNMKIHVHLEKNPNATGGIFDISQK